MFLKPKEKKYWKCFTNLESETESVNYLVLEQHLP